MSGESEGKLNRFLLIALALLAVFAVAAVIALAWGAPDGSIARIADLAGWLRRHNDRETKLILTAGGAVIILAMLMAVILELTPSPTQRMRIRNVKAGDATITTRAIADWLDAVVGQIEHIVGCKSTVARQGRRVEVILELHVDSAADLARTAEDACARARQLVEQRIGVEMAGPPRARLRYRELRLRSGAPQPEPASPADAELQEERDQREQPQASQAAEAPPRRAPGPG